MEANNSVAVFESKTIRRLWHKEEWFFSVVDVVGALTDSEDPRKYWNKLSQRLRDEGNESVTICHQLKLMSTDGKFYETDCANIEGLFARKEKATK
jgi:DNA-damage-inducible protein D